MIIRNAGPYIRALLFLLVFLAPSSAFGAQTFTVTIPAGTEVVMQDPAAVLPLTVTNQASSSRDIREVVFSVDTARYNISAATAPPAGWCAKSFSTASITFALEQGSGACSNASTPAEIAPGGSLLFNLTVLPLAAAADVTGETLAGVSVATQGGFSLSGGLPTWTKRSLEATFFATPGSIGIGGEITLVMQVTNRSTSTQSALGSIPSPPSTSSAIVTNTGGPYYGAVNLDGIHATSDSIITVDDTSAFPASGTILIDSEEICYTGTIATAFTGITRGCNGTTAASHVDNSMVYDLTPFSLSPGENKAVIWKFSADLSGSVTFSGKGTNGGGTAKSATAVSNTVIISAFSAVLTISQGSVISGQNVTVRMTVRNNGSTALVNVAPSALTPCAGGASETIVSGAAPPSISSLAPGASGVFEWTYLITGPAGGTYCLTGSAAADGPAASNTSTSNTGTVAEYAVTVSPVTVASATTNQAFYWEAYNGSACSIKKVSVETPASGADWVCSSVTPPAGWSASCGATVDFLSSASSNDIAGSSTGNFSITFSTTETVLADKTVQFPVTVTARGCGSSSSTLASYVTVSKYATSITHSPPGPIPADGSSVYTMTATLTNGGIPVSGRTLAFSTTNGTLGAASVMTDSNGTATVVLTAPNSTVDTGAVVTADYPGATGTDTVSFTGWTLANLQYWGGLSTISPSSNTSVDCGSPYSFTMNVRNISSITMNIQSGSYFAFNDSSSGGSAVFLAYLDSPVTIPGNSTATLTFGGTGVTVEPAFIAGIYQPTINPTPPPESGLFFTDGGVNDQYRTVTDSVVVAGGCGAVKVKTIEWREMR